MAAASPTSLDHPAGGPCQTKRQSPTGVSPPPTTTNASSKRPTTDSKDHDHRLTIVLPYAGYFDVAAGHEAPRWVGWTGLRAHPRCVDATTAVTHVVHASPTAPGHGQQKQPVATTGADITAAASWLRMHICYAAVHVIVIQDEQQHSIECC